MYRRDGRLGSLVRTSVRRLLEAPKLLPAEGQLLATGHAAAASRLKRRPDVAREASLRLRHEMVEVRLILEVRGGHSREEPLCIVTHRGSEASCEIDGIHHFILL
jgi:hypothetical protein